MNSIGADGWAVERDLTLGTATLREPAMARTRPCMLISVGSVAWFLDRSIRGRNSELRAPGPPVVGDPQTQSRRTAVTAASTPCGAGLQRPVRDLASGHSWCVRVLRRAAPVRASRRR